MSYEVDFVDVSTVGLESSPIADALAGLRANEARYFKNKYDHVFTVEPAAKAKDAVALVARILKEERDIVIAARPLEATTIEVENIRWTYVFYEDGLSINVLYPLDDPAKRAVGFKLSEGMEIPEELGGFKFAAAEVEAGRDHPRLVLQDQRRVLSTVRLMRASVTLHMDAPPEKVWGIVSDITRMGEFSPEVVEAEWLGDATGPALGARYRGHVKRNENTPFLYWTTCEVTECVPGEVFEFAVVMRDRPINIWRYEFEARDGGTDVTESFDLGDNLFTKVWRPLGGFLRERRNRRDMLRTLERVKAVAEGAAA